MTPSMNIECKHVDEKLLDFLYEELAPTEKSAFQTHIAGCARCQAELGAFGRVRAAVKDVPMVEPPSSLSAKLLFQAAQQAPRGARASGKVLPFLRRAWQHPAYAMAAGFIAIAGVTGWQLMVKGELASAPVVLSSQNAASAPAEAAPPPAVAAAPAPALPGTSAGATKEAPTPTATTTPTAGARSKAAEAPEDKRALALAGPSGGASRSSTTVASEPRPTAHMSAPPPSPKFAQPDAESYGAGSALSAGKDQPAATTRARVAQAPSAPSAPGAAVAAATPSALQEESVRHAAAPSKKPASPARSELALDDRAADRPAPPAPVAEKAPSSKKSAVERPLAEGESVELAKSGTSNIPPPFAAPPDDRNAPAPRRESAGGGYAQAPSPSSLAGLGQSQNGVGSLGGERDQRQDVYKNSDGKQASSLGNAGGNANRAPQQQAQNSASLEDRCRASALRSASRKGGSQAAQSKEERFDYAQCIARINAPQAIAEFERIETEFPSFRSDDIRLEVQRLRDRVAGNANGNNGNVGSGAAPRQYAAPAAAAAERGNARGVSKSSKAKRADAPADADQSTSKASGL